MAEQASSDETADQVVVVFPGGKQASVPRSVIRTSEEVHELQAKANAAGGLCAYAPDPDADYKAGFTAGVAEGRRLAEHQGWVDPTPHGKTGLGVLIAIALLVFIIIGAQVAASFDL